MTTGATSFGLWARDMVFAGLKIAVVVARGAGGPAGKLLPVLALGSAMAGFAVSQILGDPIAHHDLGVTQVRIVGHLLIGAHHKVWFTVLDTRQQLAAVDLVDEDLEFEILTALGIDELGGVTESAVAYGLPRATVIFERVVAVVAGAGLDHGTLSFYLAAAGNELKDRIGHEFSFFSGDFSADYMGGGSVISGGQSGFESIGEKTRFSSSEDSPVVIARLQRFGKCRFPGLAFVEILLGENSGENIVAIASFAVFFCLDRGNSEPDAIRIEADSSNG